jgi:hypothetical protein
MPKLTRLSSATRACLEALIEQNLLNNKTVFVRLSPAARLRAQEELATLEEICRVRTALALAFNHDALGPDPAPPGPDLRPALGDGPSPWRA